MTRDLMITDLVSQAAPCRRQISCSECAIAPPSGPEALIRPAPKRRSGASSLRRAPICSRCSRRRRAHARRCPEATLRGTGGIV